MAEGFLADRSARLLGGDTRVGSAGTWARPGQAAMPEAVRAAAERGVDIRAIRSTPLASDLVAAADLVLAMTADQREEIVSQSPEVFDRVFTLKELVTLVDALTPATEPTRDGLRARIADAHRLRMSADAPAVPDQDVADPIGMSLETYRAVAWEIETLIDRLMEHLYGIAPEPARRTGAGA
jgi:protein-tyrosine-phosphatase